MAWERRERGGLYYTRTHRINGRQVRDYIGTGWIGLLAALEDAERRAERQRRRQAWISEKKSYRAVEDHLDALGDLCQEWIIRELNQAGYHQHRGEWRRRK